MTAYRHQLYSVLKRLLLLLVPYTLCRVLFYILYYSQFKECTFTDVCVAHLTGLRFDVLVICWVNLIYILVSLIPHKRYFNAGFQNVLKIIYTGCNSIAILCNCIDLAYYGFTHKRFGYDTLIQLTQGQIDLSAQLDNYILDYVGLVLLFVVLVFILQFGWNISKTSAVFKTSNSVKAVGINIGTACLALVMVFLGLRGGWQYIPLQMVDAGKYVSPKLMPLVLNTPFTIIRSAESQHLEDLHFMPQSKAFNMVKPVHHFKSQKRTDKNVVILILEGFSKEFTGLSGRKSLTPFLDSLMTQSLVFTNAWSNGKQSIEGIPAILSGMPSLMPTSFINSVYCTHPVNSLAQLLKHNGYTSAFFHGGKNGTMNFDAYAAAAGFDKYYGMREYNNDADFDGSWGIWDEPYLRYCVNEISKFKVPFLSSIFTLSSHHPFKLPAAYKNKFPKNGLDIGPCIGYTDYALRQFFYSAQQKPWYKNTLFVIVPDHTANSNDPFYANALGQHAIPLIFFTPDNSFKGQCSTLMQHIDIMPSILDTLGFNRPFFAFGKSVFKPVKNRMAWFYSNGTYGLINDSLYAVFSNHTALQAYKYTCDSSLLHPLRLDALPLQHVTHTYQSFLQVYHTALNTNSTFIK
ncbi:MAG: LTA synthase family protein [Bacteroidia bacterium]